MGMELAASLAVAAVVFSLVFLGSRLMSGAGGGNLTSRLTKYSELKSAPVVEKKSKRRERTKATDLLVRTIDRVIENQSFASKLQTALARADVRLTVGEFLIVWLATFLICIVIGDLVFGTIVHTIVLGVIGLVGPRWYLRYRANQRLKRFSNQLADTIIMMANGLRSGYSVLQSMEMISKEMSPPIAGEFGRVVKEVGIGLSPEEALGNLVRRIRSVDMEIMVMAMNVQREIGGNLSVILDTIAHTIRERVRIKGEIKTLTAQATLSGYIISLLPLGLAFVIYTIDHKYISFFWEDTSCGLPMMIASLFFMTVGFFIMRKITQIEV